MYYNAKSEARVGMREGNKKDELYMYSVKTVLGEHYPNESKNASNGHRKRKQTKLLFLAKCLQITGS